MKRVHSFEINSVKLTQGRFISGIWFTIGAYALLIGFLGSSHWAVDAAVLLILIASWHNIAAIYISYLQPLVMIPGVLAASHFITELHIGYLLLFVVWAIMYFLAKRLLFQIYHHKVRVTINGMYRV